MQPLMYTEIADWFHLLTAPEEYAEEAAIYLETIRRFAPQAKTMLELGSGGGNNASHLKQRFDMTLVELSPEMIRLSRSINLELEHLQGDMRTVRLGRLFDAVFIHDAIMYMTSLADLRAAIHSASLHCRAGGVLLLAPDCTRETFKAGTDCGGHDGPERGMRYLEWSWDPDPNDSSFVTDYAYLLREPDGSVRSLYDRHILGLFSQAEWMRLLEAEGFEGHVLPFEHSEVEPEATVMFVGVKISI